jgi:hypothetical protein
LEQRSVRIHRFRGSRKRIERLRLTPAQALLGVWITLFILFAAVFSSWLVINFHE